LVVFSVVVVECVTLGGWIYLRHGEHIAQFADIAWSRLNGKEVIYAERCATNGQTSVRLVLISPLVLNSPPGKSK
jgi:hypothetical protein